MRRIVLIRLLLFLCIPFCKAAEFTDSAASMGRPWVGRVVGAGIGVAVNASVTELLKNVVHEKRPDGSDNRSFPSRHASYAFVLASVASHELSVYSPLWSVGAYTAANAVAMQRVFADRHYPGDVLTGAALGIFSAELGYGLSRLLFSGDVSHIRLASAENSSGLSASTVALIPFRSYRRGHRVGCGVESSLRGNLALSELFGLGASFGLRAQPVYTDGHFEGFLNGASLSIDGYVCKPLNRGRFDVRLSIGLLRYFDRPDYDIAPWRPLIGLNAGICRHVARSLCVGARLGYDLCDISGDGGVLSVAVVTKAEF